MLRRLLLTAVLVGCSRDKVDAPPSPDQLVTVRTSAKELASFGRVISAKPGLRITLPVHATQAATLAFDGARSLAIRATGVRDVAGTKSEGAMVFASALPSTDVLVSHDGERLEEVRVMHDAAAPDEAAWAIDAGDGIVDVRLEDGQVKALDRSGRVVLRSDKMFAVDHKGVRREPVVSLTRAANGWALAAKLDRTGLAYPIVLDPIWLPGPTGATRYSGHKAVALGGKVYVVGSTSKFEVFDSATSSFSTLADCTDCFSVDAAFATSDSKVRIVSNGKVQTFNPGTGAWTVGTATGTLSGAEYGQLTDGKVIAVGGYTNPSGAEIYDPGADTWTTRANLTEGRQDSILAVLPSGKVWVAGGFSGSTAISTTELYDPTANTWSSGPTMTKTLSGASVIGFAGGSVALFGGRTGSGAMNATIMVYDSVGGTIKDGTTMATARDRAAFVLTPDSKVYAIGGSIGPETSTNSVEVSAPLLGLWSASANMVFPREGHTATALPDSRVLVVGGNGGMTGGSPSATEILSSFSNGVSCTWGGECASGFCSSGVCCDTACTGDCQRCDVAGTLGQCKPAPATTECGSASVCSGSTLTPRGRCSGGDGKCVAATTVQCPGALMCADTISCLTKCTKNEDCAGGACDTTTGLCSPSAADAGPAVAPVPEGAPKVLGSAQRCTSPSECASGFCVDGVCCDSECKERCHSCALPSSPGRCSEEPLGVDLRAECGPALSCAGTCGKGGVCTTSVEGSQCQPSVCTGPTKGRGSAICKALGVKCNAEEGVEFECGAYGCDPAFGACRTSCTASDACAPGYTCNLTTKSCDRLPPNEDDSGCAIGQVGAKQGGAFVALIAALMLIGTRRRRITH